MSRRYPNPPVVEALCEIYTTGSAWDATVPGRFYERVRETFPRRREVHGVGIEVSLGPTTPAAKLSSRESRSQFSTEDGSRMLQVAPDLVVVNQLRPYPAFEDWKPEIPKAFGIYRELANPVGIQQVGLRYLNRITIPGVEVKMDRYFQLYPELPKGLESLHGPFMLRIEIPTASKGHTLLVTFGSAPAEAQGTYEFVLDLYDQAEAPGIDALEAPIDEAHAEIERVFEAILTDATRALFQEDRGAGSVVPRSTV